MTDPVVTLRGLRFHYPNDPHPVLDGVDLDVGAGMRCLLVGANGAGKTTLLGIVGGRHMVPDEQAYVLGRPAFSDTSLANRVSYLGGRFPLDVDLRVSELLASRPNADAARRDHLMGVLAIDPRWRMNRVSDGQRRRVQILLSLLAPCELLLLDEVTTDLDVIARTDLLDFLRRETETRGTAILYATHILDGLEAWATHLAFLDGGRIRLMAPIDAVPQLAALREQRVAAPLLRLVDQWLRGGFEGPPGAA